MPRLCTALAVAASLGAVLGLPAVAGAERYAVIVAANHGDRGEVVLRYAQSDGQRVARVLHAIGGFAPQHILSLEDPTADEVRSAVIGVNAQIRSAAAGDLLFVFYSGHGDSDALHLGGTRLALGELRALLAGSAAAARVLVIDACRSGGATRVKGGVPGPAFEIRANAVPAAEGLAILTSSAASEDSQESDVLGASFFTHYFLSAIMGAADEDDDGAVSIAEAFDYASARTLSATAGSAAGPQHPTYGVELRGRESLMLTRPGLYGRGHGVLRFDRPGDYFVQRGGHRGPIAAELSAERGGRRIALEAGRYLVTRRESSYLLEADVVLPAGQTVSVDAQAFRRIAYAQVVRKGGTARRLALSAFVLLGVRGSLLALGPAWRSELGLRADLPALSLELRASLGGSDTSNARLGIRTYETALTIAGLRMFDVGPVAFGLGLEVGGLWLAQRFTQALTVSRDAFGGSLAALGQFHWAIGSRLYIRAEAALLTYFLPVRDATGATGLETPVSFRFSTGLGVFF